MSVRSTNPAKRKKAQVDPPCASILERVAFSYSIQASFHQLGYSSLDFEMKPFGSIRNTPSPQHSLSHHVYSDPLFTTVVLVSVLK